MSSFEKAYHTFVSLPKVEKLPFNSVAIGLDGECLGSGYFNADFGAAQQIVSINEGGYQALPSDKGNYVGSSLIGTNFGIAAPTLAAYLGRTPTVADMKGLTYDTALAIYKKNYWDAIQGDDIKSDSVAAAIYDGAVNQGVGGIKKIIAPLLPSGVYNVSDLNNFADQQDLFNKIKQARIDYYNSLGGQFLNSWLARVNKLAFTDAVQQVKQDVKNVATKVLGEKAVAVISENKGVFVLILGASLTVGILLAVISNRKTT